LESAVQRKKKMRQDALLRREAFFPIKRRKRKKWGGNWPLHHKTCGKIRWRVREEATIITPAEGREGGLSLYSCQKAFQVYGKKREYNISDLPTLRRKKKGRKGNNVPEAGGKKRA